MVGYDPEKKTLTDAEILFASTASGFVARFLLQPIDVIKIRLQLQIEPIRCLTNSKYQSLVQTIGLIRAEEGVRAFWKGHLAAQILSISFTAAQMYGFEKLTKQYAFWFPSSKPSENDRTVTHFFVGSLAASLAVVSCHPMDVLRTRFVAQGEPKIYKSYLGAIRSIAIGEGVRGFYRGLIPAILLYAPVSALTFGFFDLFSRFWSKMPLKDYESLGHVFNGGAAGLLAKLIVYPFDLTKKRLEVVNFEEARRKFGQTRTYSGMINCLTDIVRNEGFTGLYKGTAPSLIKAYLSTAVTMGVYEYSCSRLRERTCDE